MINAYLNELSLTFLPNNKIDTIIKDFVIVAIALKELNNSIAVLEYFSDVDLMQYKIYENKYLGDYLKNSDLDLWRKLKSIVTTTFEQEATLEEITIDGKPSKGAAKAHLKDGITISFLSHERWTTENVEAKYSYIEDNYIKEKNITIRHAANITMLLYHKTWISKVLPAINTTIDEPIPFTQTTKYLIGEDYYEKSQGKPTEEKVAIFKELAEKVAHLNQYKREDKLTQKNNRIIYQNRDKTLYLALDTQHGTFECCNNNGIHQKEINFLGQKTKEADKAGKHNIKL